MRTTTLLLIVALATGCKRDKESTSNNRPGEAASAGKVVTANDLKFEAWFPGAPTETKTKDGKRLMFAIPERQTVYVVQCSQFEKPVPLTDSVTIDLFFVGAKGSLLAGNQGGKILSEEKYQFDGKYPAWKVDVQSPKIGLYRTRFIHRGTHFYQIAVAGSKTAVESADAVKFLDSLKLTE